MKEVLKLIIYFVLITFIVSVGLWVCGDCIPIYKQLLQTMEMITNYHLTFMDYLKSVFWGEMAGILVYLLKKIVEWL